MWRFIPTAVLALLLLTTSCSPPGLPAGAAAVALAQDPHTDRPVRLWQDAAIFRAVAQEIAGARTSVAVEMYEFGRADLVRELVAQRRRGLDVRVIVDPSVPVSRRTGALLSDSGVAVREYPIDQSRHQIDHVKLLLTDAAALVGGMNWGRHSSFNHDYALQITPPSWLRPLARLFEQDWQLAGGTPGWDQPEPGPPVVETTPGQQIRHLLEGDIEAARRSIRAEIFVLTDAQVEAELIAAAARGVAVRVLMDPNQDVNLPAYSALAAGGVGVRWFAVARGAKLHAKAGLFDGTLLLGSANWSLSGLSVNHELDVQTDDSLAAASFSARFDADWRNSESGFCCG